MHIGITLGNPQKSFSAKKLGRWDLVTCLASPKGGGGGLKAGPLKKINLFEALKKVLKKDDHLALEGRGLSGRTTYLLSRHCIKPLFGAHSYRDYGLRLTGYFLLTRFTYY